jgi:hypothetical protein
VKKWLGLADLPSESSRSGKSVLSGWNFTAGGYNPGDPVHRSLEVGYGYGPSDLAVWHYDGSNWTTYAADDLAYDNTYAGFTVNGFAFLVLTSVANGIRIAILIYLLSLKRTYDYRSQGWI